MNKVLTKIKKISWLDTTLRDGEQTPGVSFLVEDKEIIALALARLGVDIIEAGSAITSEGERMAIKAVVKTLRKAGFDDIEIASYCRIRKEDIDFAFECGVTSIHLVVPASDLHINDILKMDRATVLKMAVDMTKYAKDLGLIVEISGEDASRADFEYLKSIYKACIEAGADRICFCDTVGHLVPEKTYEIFKNLDNSFNVPIAVHCHNDFGQAVANTIAALRAGATQVHSTINGIGERAGNASFEEIIMILEVLYEYETGIKCADVKHISELVSELSGIAIAKNNAVVGNFAFAHEAGIHVNGLVANKATYEPFDPKLVGGTRRIIFGKHTGRSSVVMALEGSDIYPDEQQISEIVERIKNLGDKGKRVTDADFKAIAETVMGIVSIPSITLKKFSVMSGKDIIPTASVKVEINGKEYTHSATGTGPVDAAVSAIKDVLSNGNANIKFENYHVDSITGGTDALVRVEVTISREEKTTNAQASGEDIVNASVEAVLIAINRLME